MTINYRSRYFGIFELVVRKNGS